MVGLGHMPHNFKGDIVINRKELALCWGLASTICMAGVFATAVYYNTNSVLLTFPFGEHYLELGLAIISIILMGYELFWGER